MKSREQFRQLVRQETMLRTRLFLARSRLEEAEQEHIWAIVSAHAEGLSIRKIAKATGLSSSRVHQLLHSDEANCIPEFLNSLNQPAINDDDDSSFNVESQSISNLEQRIAKETEVLRWCLDWLEQLERGERVVVDLRAESDPEHAFVGVDRQWVLRVLRRVTGDLDRLSRNLPTTEDEALDADPVADGVRHRRRLGEPEPVMSSLSNRQQLEILREKMFYVPRNQSQ